MRNAARDLFPALAFVGPLLYILVKVGDDLVVAVLDVFPFSGGVVADAYLYEAFQLRYFLEGVVHHTGVAVDKTFIRLPEVTVGVDLEDTEIAVFLGYRLIVT